MITHHNRSFQDMLEVAQDRLKGRNAADISAKTGITFYPETSQFRFMSLGREMCMNWPECALGGAVSQWHHLVLMHYFDLADGTPLTGNPMPFGNMSGGLIRGSGFDSLAEEMAKSSLGMLDCDTLEASCRSLGADIVPSNADICAVFHLAPMFPITFKMWFADDEFPASGRMFVDESADHYLTVEDAVTIGTDILEKLI